jgi:hypothetical protein
MSQHLPRWMYLSQAIVQRLTMAALLLLAAAGTVWCVAAALGFAPWLQLGVGLGGEAPVDAGKAVQIGLTLFVLGLCYFVPMSDRVLRLESSHRAFRVSMWDVARAYHAAHAADRDGVFELSREFDSVRERLEYLRRHPELGKLEPEILEIAAQMSHESRELAETYATERVERARQFLRARQQEAEQMQARVHEARAACEEIRRRLGRVETDEATARAEIDRLRAELEALMAALDPAHAEPSRPSIEVVSHRTFAAE